MANTPSSQPERQIFNKRSWIIKKFCKQHFLNSFGNKIQTTTNQMGDFKKDMRTNNDELFSNAVRAGKRTYFFDIRQTRGNDHYLTITESKKVFDDSGNFRYEKHKIFLYKEDFEKFGNALTEAFEIVKRMQNGEDIDTISEADSSGYSDINFDSLGEANDD